MTDSVVDEMFEVRHALLAIETIADQNRVVYARASAPWPLDAARSNAGSSTTWRTSSVRCGGSAGARRSYSRACSTSPGRGPTAKMDLAMSRIALLSAVALPISIISSIYGMQLWVFTSTRLDILAMVLVLMGVLTYGMLRWARSQGWW